ncbi:Alpha-(1,3)-fucosyltransferase 10 [Willisornis vidua]|uniref:Fucosyltransferase n=1 Tax=Willisornis vidua TaxID=1566151 RepID=A0ABQ9DUT9_9PASS|nr:Alpha-(1,3)-fucosyltransferase 10 [Willisornis vidua]
MRVDISQAGKRDKMRGHSLKLLHQGTDFSIDSLPLPRKEYHDWALFHEESPKNNYKLFHEATITLFNHTATFSRHSHLPLTTQYLEDVEVLKSLRFMIPLQMKNSLRKRLAPLVYVQSDCNPPSDRDSYVRELMCHIEVDSYGECLHNRDLPQHLRNPAAMDDGNFLKILAQYKFILAFENAICEDYITEKLWRPLKLGVVPVYFGSPSIVDWLPSNKSAILVSNFSHPRELAQYIKTLDRNDEEYESYLQWKLKGDISNPRLLTAMKERKWGLGDVTQDNYIDTFECMVCNRVWENIRRKEKVNVLPVPITPELDPRVFQVGSHQSRVEGLNPLHCSAGHTAFDAGQDAIGFQGCGMELGRPSAEKEPMEKRLNSTPHSGTCLLALEREKVLEEYVSYELGKSTLFRLAWLTRVHLTLAYEREDISRGLSALESVEEL